MKLTELLNHQNDTLLSIANLCERTKSIYANDLAGEIVSLVRKRQESYIEMLQEYVKD